ncbi:MAG: START-like domain-containing protein, partial [Flavobacteriaceae bacterium]
VDALTKDVSLMVTDFSDDEDEVEEAKMLWENQIDELKHTIGA